MKKVYAVLVQASRVDAEFADWAQSRARNAARQAPEPATAGAEPQAITPVVAAPATGLVERLRSVPKDLLVSRFDGVSCDTGKWCHEAADECMRLKRENEAMFEALQGICALEWRGVGPSKEQYDDALAAIGRAMGASPSPERERWHAEMVKS